MINNLTDAEYEQELGSKRVSIVMSVAPWCGACKFMKPLYEKYSEDFKEYSGTEVPFYLIDNETNKEFTEKFHVDALPSIMFFIYGVMVFKMEGIAQKQAFEVILRKTLDIKYEMGDNEQ